MSNIVKIEDFEDEIINIMSNSDSRNEGDFIDMYLDQIMTTEDTSSSFGPITGDRAKGNIERDVNTVVIANGTNVSGEAIFRNCCDIALAPYRHII